MPFNPRSAPPSASPRGQSRRSALAALARAASVLAIAALVTCDTIDNFDVTVGGGGTVPAGTVVDQLLNVLPFHGFDSIDLTTEFKNQGVTKDDVDSVGVTAFTLRIEGPPGATFDFLTSISFYAETGGQPKLLIAKLDNVPSGAAQLSLAVQPSVELKPYVVAPTMKITAEVQGTRPQQDTNVAAEVILDVDVTVPGC